MPKRSAPTKSARVPALGAETRQRILSAMDRLLGGESRHKEPTYVNLALEAGVGRATLNRAPDLKAQFQQRLDELTDGRGSTTNPEIRVRALERKLRESREEAARLRGLTDTMAQQINYLCAVVKREQERTGARPATRVIPIAERRRD